MWIWLISPWDPHYNPMEYPDNISPVDTPYLFDPWVESLCLMLTLHTSPIKSHSGPTKVHPPSQIPDKSHKSSQLCPLFAWFVHIKSKLYRHDFASNPPWFIGCNPKCLMLKSNMFESHVIVMKFPSPPDDIPIVSHCALPIVPSNSHVFQLLLLLRSHGDTSFLGDIPFCKKFNPHESSRFSSSLFPIFRGCPGGCGRDPPWRSRPRGRRAAELGRTQRHIGRAAGLVHGGSGGLWWVTGRGWSTCGVGRIGRMKHGETWWNMGTTQKLGETETNKICLGATF